MKGAIRQIIQDVEAGERFSDAFSKHTAIFPEFYLRMLAVGEATGGIPLTLQQLTDNLQRRKTVADKVRRALIYPAISLVVAIVAAFVLVTYSLPSLTGLLKEFGGELPVATQLLITVIRRAPGLWSLLHCSFHVDDCLVLHIAPYGDWIKDQGPGPLEGPGSRWGSSRQQYVFHDDNAIYSHEWRSGRPSKR